MARTPTDARPIIIKKIKKVAGGHHGGAWKVAYADFVTAMMAFFMLLWLLNVSDAETLQGLADYFTPSNATMSNASGAGGILGGTALEAEGARSSGSISLSSKSSAKKESESDSEQPVEAEVEVAANPEQWQAKIVSREDQMFSAIEDEIKAAIQKTPDLSRHEDQVLIEQTPDGMRIQLIDKDNRPMFKRGTAELYPFAVEMLNTVGKILQGLPNRTAITGHTDANPSRAQAEYSNWELSADRANSARRVLAASGVSGDRFSEVTGRAATQPLFPDDPLRPENKRVAIMILREAPVLDPKFGGN